MKVDYSSIFLKSAEMTWRRKKLWLFGFVLFLTTFPYLTQLFLVNNDLYNLNKIIILVVLSLLFRVTSKISIIKAISHDAFYKNTNLWLIVKTAFPYFTKLIFLEFLTLLLEIFVFIIIMLPVRMLYVQGNFLLAIVMGLGSIALFLIVLFLIVISKRFAYYYFVLANETLTHSIIRGYGILTKHLSSSLFVAAYAISIQLAVQLLIILLSGAILMPIFLIGGIAYAIIPQVLVGFFITFIGAILVVFYYLVCSMMTDFFEWVWQGFFQEIASSKHLDVNKEIKVINKLPAPEAI